MKPQQYSISIYRALWAVVFICGSSAAVADGQWPVLSLGVKAWINSWTSWGIDQKLYNNSSYQLVVPINSATETSWIPYLSLRYGKLVASASYMVDTRYTLVGAVPAGPLTGVSATRTESDASVGYYFLPGLALTGGYKQLKQEYGDTYKWSGPVLALNASAPIGAQGLALYGTFGYGLFSVKLPSGARDASDHSSLDAVYTVGEFGLAYAFGHSASGRRPLAVTAGYRSQTVKTKSYGLASVSSAQVQSQYTTTDLRDITQGFAVSLTGSF